MTRTRVGAIAGVRISSFEATLYLGQVYQQQLSTLPTIVLLKLFEDKRIEENLDISTRRASNLYNLQ
jgi:hypothetical protein